MKKNKHGFEPKKVHAGTIHEKTYLAACDFAELILKGGQD